MREIVLLTTTNCSSGAEKPLARALRYHHPAALIFPDWDVENESVA